MNVRPNKEAARGRSFRQGQVSLLVGELQCLFPNLRAGAILLHEVRVDQALAFIHAVSDRQEHLDRWGGRLLHAPLASW